MDNSNEISLNEFSLMDQREQQDTVSAGSLEPSEAAASNLEAAEQLKNLTQQMMFFLT